MGSVCVCSPIEFMHMLEREISPQLSSTNLLFPLFLNLTPKIQEEIIDKLGETSKTWQTGTTLHINCVLFQRRGSRADTILIALATNLGFIKEVHIIPYLFESKDLLYWGLARSLTSIMPKLFHILQSIIPRKVPITLEEEDKEIVELFWAGKPYYVWYMAYENKYNLPLTFPPKSEYGWEILE